MVNYNLDENCEMTDFQLQKKLKKTKYFSGRILEKVSTKCKWITQSYFS